MFCFSFLRLYDDSLKDTSQINSLIHKSPITIPTKTKKSVTKDGVTSGKPKPKRKQKGALGLLMQYDSDSGGSAASIDSDSTSNHSISPLSCTSTSPDRIDKRSSPLSRVQHHHVINGETNNNTKPKKRTSNGKTPSDKKRSKPKASKLSHDASGYVNLGDTVSGVQQFKSQRSRSPAVATTAATQLTSQPMYQATGIPGYSFPQGPFPFQSGNYSFPPPNYPQYLSNAAQSAGGYYQWAGSYPSMPCQGNFPYLNFANNSSNGQRDVFR